MQFGILEEISTDDGPGFTTSRMAELLQDWNLHNLSSAYHPCSNLWAEVGVKDMKLLLLENVNSDGSINNSKVITALLTFIKHSQLWQ